MMQEATTWDWRQIHPLLSTSMRIHIVFLLVACLSTVGKLAKVWRSAPPFRLSRQAGSSTYTRSLRHQSVSLKNWIGCAFIAWGISVSTSFYQLSVRLLDEKRFGSFGLLFGFLGFSRTLTMTLLVVLFMFLVRWHITARADHLEGM